MGDLISLADRRHARGLGFVIIRQQYRPGDRVLVKATGAVGVFDRYDLETGKVWLFVRGQMQAFNQDSVEPAGSAFEIPVHRKEVSR